MSGIINLTKIFIFYANMITNLYNILVKISAKILSIKSWSHEAFT